MRSKSILVISLALLMAVLFALPVSMNFGVDRTQIAKTGPSYWGTAETFWNVSTGTSAPASFNDMVLVEQTYTDSVVLDGWLWEMTKQSMSGTVANFSPSGPATRTNDWNISAEITRPREDSAYSARGISDAAGNQSLIIYLTNETGFVLAGLNMTTGSPYGESISVYDALNSIWHRVADDIRPAFSNDFDSYGYGPDRYVVSFSHEYLSSAIEIVVRNTATGVVSNDFYSIPTLEGVDNPQLRLDISSIVGIVSPYYVSGGWIIDNLMFRSMRSRYPTIGPVYETVAKQDPVWLDVRDIDGNLITDADVSINGTSASYNGAVGRYEASSALPVDWDVAVPYSVLVDGMLVNDTLKVSTTPDLDSRVSLPRWWNGWDWVTVLGRDDSSTPLSAPQTFNAFDHPKTSYINSFSGGNSTDLLPTQSEIAIHYPHDLSSWGSKFWSEAVTSATTGHSTFESTYWFASRWDDPRYVGIGDSYISLANPGNSGSWEQMFAEYAEGTRVMGICSQPWVAGNSSLIGSYWLYGGANTELPSWASWHPDSKLDMMDMFRGLNIDNPLPSGWATASLIAQHGGVLRVYSHGPIADPGFLRWICDNKTNTSYENWKATDGEVGSYVYGSRSTDVVHNSSSTEGTWVYDVSRRSPYAAGYWKVPVTVAIDVTDRNVSEVEIISGAWDLKMSDGSLRDLNGGRIMDVGFDIRGNTLYVSYFWNASSSLRVSTQSLANPRPVSLPETSALAWENYSCTVLSTAPDNGTSTWTLEDAPSWLSIDAYSDTTCVLSGLPKASGTYEVSLAVSDLNTTEYLNWTITVVRLKFVDGYVRDSGAKPLSNITVMVKFLYGHDNIRSIKYADTTASGYYSVAFLESDWSPGDKIEVSSVYDNGTAFNSTTAGDYPYQEVDLGFAAEVPEFGAVFGAAGVVASFALLACYIIRRRQK